MLKKINLALVVALLSGVCAGQAFSGPYLYNAHEGIRSGFVLADVNHDGFADVLALQVNAHSVSVLLNDRTGALHQSALYDAGSDVAGIAVADFNGDGKLDIAVGNHDSQTVSILLGNGDGTFQARRGYAVVGGPNSIAVGDFNNDGKQDIAALSGDTAKITILTNTGTGFTSSSFSPPQDYSAPALTGDVLFGLTAGDFNADGRMDLAYVDHCTSPDNCGPVALETYYALFNTTSGWQAHSAGGGSGTFSLHAADVDNDGKADLVSSYYGCYHEPCTGVTVHYSNGNGTFQDVQVISGYGMGGDPSDAVVADLNNDGINDIASPVSGGYDPGSTASVSSGFAVYTGKGGRTGFNKPVYFSSGATPAITPFIIGAAFLRAQTRKDVVMDGYANDVIVFRNTASVAAEPCQYPVFPAIHYCGPANGSTVIGPGVSFKATARAASGPVNRLELWVDGHKVFQTFNDRLNRTQTLSKGTHTATVVQVDSAGGLIKAKVPKFTVK
jgi:hypothetical protein